MSLFDQIKKNIQKSIGFAKDKSKEAITMYNLHSSVWLMKKQKSHLLKQLGEIIYEEYKKGSALPDVAVKKCQEIMDIEADIRRVQEEIQQTIHHNREKLREQIQLPQKFCECGAPIKEGEKFCGICGKKIKEEPPSEEPSPPVKKEIPEEDILICKKCGTKNRKHDLFCAGCGAKLREDENPTFEI